MNWQFSVTFAFPLLVCECVCRYTRVSMYGQACVHVSVYMHMYLCASGHVCVCVYVHVCALFTIEVVKEHLPKLQILFLAFLTKSVKWALHMVVLDSSVYYQ